MQGIISNKNALAFWTDEMEQAQKKKREKKYENRIETE